MCGDTVELVCDGANLHEHVGSKVAQKREFQGSCPRSDHQAGVPSFELVNWLFKEGEQGIRKRRRQDHPKGSEKAARARKICATTA